jgi:stage IV sporulation protein B
MSDVKSGWAKESRYDANINLLGIFPVKKVSVSVIQSQDVVVLGNPFGIKIYTDGVLVVKIDSVDTEKGKKNPAAEAGIMVGDYILTVAGEKVTSNEDVARLIEKSNGKQIVIKIKRNNDVYNVMLTPKLSYSTGKYKAGIWVKDSSAGIGTLSFYSPVLNMVCGLGHAVCENETGNPLKLESGRLVTAEILGIDKGRVGTPGGLVGKFSNLDLGELVCNSETGVYAVKSIGYERQDLIKIALKQEIVCGKAQILSTVDEKGKKLYDCEITKVSYNNTVTKNISIKITDKELLDKTGGIVQGMSGSPIIQNGKLIGAVTHVLVDDPTKGYAIFAENMLETAQSVAEEKKLKEAS